MLTIPENDRPHKPFDCELTVIYEDDYLAAVHKPAGLLVSGNSFKTVDIALDQNLKESPQPGATSPQPIHRLDYPTTGVLLIGKTHSSIRALNQLFEDKKVDKTYYAITIGEMHETGVITSEIDGKPSESFFKRMDLVPSERFGQLNLVELKPQTGRRHQLRKHMFSIGNPILGDQEYANDGLILKGKGLYLHAYSLEFEHPFTGEQLCLKDKIHKKFGKIFPSIHEVIPRN